MYLIVGGILSFILGLIGLLNFINSMITSISARQHEFAVLRSIGMTGSQLKNMLICYGIIAAISNQMWFFTYRFTAAPLIYSAAALAGFSVIIPVVCYNRMCKSSIVSKLHVNC